MNHRRIHGLIVSIFFATPVLSNPPAPPSEEPSDEALVEFREQSHAVEDTSQQRPASVHVITIDGVISPISAAFILESIEDAEREQVQCLIIQLDTPGGL